MMQKANHLETVRKVLGYNSIDETYDYRNSGVDDRTVEKVTQVIKEYEKVISGETLQRIVNWMRELPQDSTITEFLMAYDEVTCDLQK